MRTLRALTLSVGWLLVAGSGALAANYVAAPLSGAEEVPARETHARGNATFDVSADGLQITYKLIVANNENVTASHIHLGPAGTNGGVVAFLFGPSRRAAGVRAASSRRERSPRRTSREHSPGSRSRL